MKKEKIIKAWAVIENGKLVKASGYWISPNKDNLENLLWYKGKKNLNYKVVPIEIKLLK